MKIKTKYDTYEDCKVVYAKYPCGQNALIILESHDEPLMKASCTIPEYPIADNQVLIKNWSENEGIFQELVRHKIIKFTGKKIPTDFVYAHLCDIIDPNFKESNE